MESKFIHTIAKRKEIFVAFLAIVAAALCIPFVVISAKTSVDKPRVTPNFIGRSLSLSDLIELQLDRELRPEEGRLAVFFGDLDITNLFISSGRSFSYSPKSPLLSPGENKVMVYLVGLGGEWEPLAEYPISLGVNPIEATSPSSSGDENTPDGSALADQRAFEFTPNVTINMKGQNQTLVFPEDTASSRDPYGEVDGQAGIQLKISKAGWTLNNRFDFVGVGFQKNALRFGELENEAPKFDLSSYLIELQKNRFAVRLGHVSFGSNRHLINTFSSRGLTVTVPAGKNNDLTFIAANGTSIVGYDNFFGLSRREHSVLGLAFAREFFVENPGKLRLEVTAMRGSLLPLSNFSQGEVNDAEKNLGLGFRVIGNSLKERIRYEVGFSRSRFHNPNDPQLEQGNLLTPSLTTSRNARYGEISFNFLDGLKVWGERKLKVTGTFRHEEIDPLFRSVVASSQADRKQNHFEVSATLGDLNFAYGNLVGNDNLARIASILRSNTSRNNLVFGAALSSVFTPAKPKSWLPRFSYSYDRVHQYGSAFPNGGLFTSASQIPDQESRSTAISAQWQLNAKLNFGYRYNHACQDNRQPGRELADFQSYSNGLSVGTSLVESLSMNFDLTRESQKAFETQRTDRTFRLGIQAIWQTPILKNSTLSANISTTVAGDAEDLNEARNAEFDVQWSYRFGIGKKKFRKFEAQFFIRYANRYGDSFDRVALFRGFTKSQGFNLGITFNIF